MIRMMKASLIALGMCAAATAGTAEAQLFRWPFGSAAATCPPGTVCPNTSGNRYGIAAGGCIGGNCPTGSCPTGNCPNGSCPTGSYPNGSYYGTTPYTSTPYRYDAGYSTGTPHYGTGTLSDPYYRPYGPNDRTPVRAPSASRYWFENDTAQRPASRPLDRFDVTYTNDGSRTPAPYHNAPVNTSPFYP